MFDQGLQPIVIFDGKLNPKKIRHQVVQKNRAGKTGEISDILVNNIIKVSLRKIKI